MMIAIAAVFVVACLLVVVWVGGWFLGLSLIVKIALTAIVLGLAGILWLASYIAKLLAAARLENGLIAQANQQAASVRPDRRNDILALQKQARQAIDALKRSRLGRGGKAALYALPWYVIVGPPGAGKTTAIRHSGLEFPLEQTGGAAAFRGTGGTRNCDWWFTNEAILLDTAGRYTTDSGDQAEWFAFLDLLKKNRPRKPIDGLLVALPVTDLLGITEDDAAVIAQKMRAKIDELLGHLKMTVPIYILFTKTDLVAGFSEFWNDLAKTERGQVWGMSFPATPIAEPAYAFGEEFDALMRTLHARLLRRLGNERSVAVRKTLSTFPVEMATLRPTMTHFIASLFRSSAYQDAPTLRSVFFTSGTQNARPMSRVIASMVGAFGLQLPGNYAGAVEPKSYFLTDAFRRVIFQDQSLAGRTVQEKRRQLALRIAAMAFALLMSTLLVLPALMTTWRNHELVSSTASISERLRAANWNDAATLEQSAGVLDEARARLQQLSTWRQDGPPVQLRWGMYTGNELYEGLRGVYGRAVSTAVLAAAKADLEDRLRGMDAGPMRTADNFNRDFDTLKLYSMLGSNEHVDPAWGAPRLVRRWSLMSRTHVKNEESLVLSHVAYVFELMKAKELPAMAVDNALVTRARAILAQVPQMDRLYESLVRDANTEVPAIRRELVFYGASAPFIQSRKGVKVEGAYTKQGWSRVRALLGQERANLAAEQWVLGDPAEAGSDSLIDKLRSLYFERYRIAWRDFLADLQVQDPGNAEIALDEINALSEPEWPYLRLIRTLSENVTLEMEDPTTKLAMAEKLVDKAKQVLDAGPPLNHEISPVEIAFRPIIKFGLPPTMRNPGDIPPPTGLSQYEALLTKVIGALTDLRDAESGSDPRKLSDVFQEAFRSTSALLSEQDGFTRPLIAPLLMNPVTLAWSNVVRDAGSAAGASWEAGVWQKWHDKLEGKYPFVNSPNDAALDDFLDFFTPGDGVLWSFYDESLKATLDRNGSSFAPARRFRSSINYTSEFLDVCLRRGAAFTTVLFPPKTDHAAVTFEVNVHSVSPTIGEISLEVDGASHRYRNEPEQWLTVTWPGKGQHGAKLVVKGAGGLDEEISRPGDFGLFRLLDLAELKPGRAGGKPDGSPTLVATWDLRATKEKAVVNLDIRPSRNENPLVPGYFNGYKCPRVIAVR